MDSKEIDSDVFEYTWKQYRKWAATSREQKSSIMRWRIIVLSLMVVGAICGAISGYADILPVSDAGKPVPASSDFSFITLAGYFGAVALALAAFFSTQALSRDREQRWILARSIAEACKSELFKYRLSVPPYNVADKDYALSERIERVVGKANQIAPVILPDEKLLAGIKRQKLDEESYINERVEQQRRKYYLPNAKKNTDIMRWGRWVGISLGAVAAIFSTLSATTLAAYTTNWIAVISTVTAAFTAFLFSGRYNYLALSYQSTADRLEQITLEWKLHKKRQGAAADFNPFVQEFEKVISIENNAWVAEFKKETKPIVPQTNEVENSGVT